MSDIVLTLRQIVEAIKSSILNYIGIDKNQRLVEMSYINKNEGEKCLFPYNSYKIKIYSNDHNPPHFHVEKGDWNISFAIEDGELYRVNHFGKNESTYDYIVSNIPRWLQLQSANRPHETNQQNAIETWRENND